MECSCEIDVGIDEGRPDFTSQKMVTARKDHKRIECRGVIKKGDQYEKTAGKWEGYFESEGGFYVMAGDCDGNLSERQKYVKLSSNGYARLGAGAW